MRRFLKTVAAVLGAIVVLTVIAIIAIEWAFRCPVPPPERPASIPHDAMWVGGADGDWWVQCKSVNGTRSHFHCTLYLHSQEVRFQEGDYYWEGAALSKDAVPVCDSWNGQDISCEEGDLIPTGKHIFYKADGKEKEFERTYPDKSGQ